MSRPSSTIFSSSLRWVLGFGGCPLGLAGVSRGLSRVCCPARWGKWAVRAKDPPFVCIPSCAPAPGGLGPGHEVVVGVDGREEGVEVRALHALHHLGHTEPVVLCVCVCFWGGGWLGVGWGVCGGVRCEIEI